MHHLSYKHRNFDSLKLVNLVIKKHCLLKSSVGTGENPVDLDA